MADVQANANSEHEMNTAGEENTQNTVADNTQEELKLDFEKAGEIADKRSERATKSAITDYFKQQGLTPEQANQAFADFKAKQEAAKEQERSDLTALQNKVQQYEKAETEGLKVANRRLIRAYAMEEAHKLNFRPDRVEKVIKIADLSNVDVDAQGKVDVSALNTALQQVANDLPEWLNSSKQEENKGIRVGSPSNQKAVDLDNELSKIFGNKK